MYGMQIVGNQEADSVEGEGPVSGKFCYQGPIKFVRADHKVLIFEAIIVLLQLFEDNPYCISFRW